MSRTLGFSSLTGCSLTKPKPHTWLRCFALAGTQWSALEALFHGVCADAVSCGGSRGEVIEAYDRRGAQGGVPLFR